MRCQRPPEFCFRLKAINPASLLLRQKPPWCFMGPKSASSEKLLTGLALITALLLICPTAIKAQTETTGALQGQIVDAQTGDPIIGAIVRLINRDTGVEYRVRTASNGAFNKFQLLPGTYIVRVQLPGYRVHERAEAVLLTRISSVRPNPIELIPEDSSLPPPVRLRDTKPPNLQVTSPQIAQGSEFSVKDSKITITGRATDESGINEVYVRDKPADLDEAGNFSAVALLKRGENKIPVTAIDIHGNISADELMIIRENPATAATAFEGDTGRYYALVIGINDYRHLRKLKTAEADAKAIDATLRGRFGFETKLLLNANRQQIFGALVDYRRKLDATANLLIYYAGHGINDREVNKAYWLPVDATEGDPSNWISADDVTTNVRGISAKHVLIVSDSCYSGTLTRGLEMGLASAAAGREKFLRKMLQGKSRTLLASGGDEPVADGGGSGHSVFARALLRGLTENERDAFTASELFNDFIQEAVAGSASQAPEYNPLSNSGHESGDFVFVRKK